MRARAHRRRLLVTAVVVAGIAGLGACGGASRPSAQPTPSNSSFDRGTFDQIPRFPRSDPLSPRNDAGGTTEQSFKANGTTAEQVLQWYGQHLDGWTVAQEPHREGSSDFAGEWVKGDRVLRVTSGPAPTVGDETTVQYSLLVKPT